MKDTNWLAIIVAAVAAMGLGFLWYGFLFQDMWMEANGITMEGDDKMFKNGVEQVMSSTPMIFNTIGVIIYALLMNWLINMSGQTTAIKGAILGVVIGLIAGIDTFLSNEFAFNSRSGSLVDGLYLIVVLGVMGLIIGGWRKK